MHVTAVMGLKGIELNTTHWQYLQVPFLISVIIIIIIIIVYRYD